MTPEEAERKAERAKQLLNDPLIIETYQAVERALIQAAKSSKTPDEALKACIAMQVFDLLKNSIAAHIETDKIMKFNFRPTLKERVGL